MSTEIDNKIIDLTERQAELQKQLDESIKDFRQARITGAPVDEIKNLQQKGAELDEEIRKIISEIENLRAKKEILANEEEVTPQSDTAPAESTTKIATQNVEPKPSRNIAKTAEKILNILKVQIMPSTECVEINEAFVKDLFSRSDEETRELLDGEIGSVLEKKRSKKKSVISRYKMQNADGYDDETPLDEFDRAVLSVIVSEILIGNMYTTPAIIFRALIGQIGKTGIVPRVNQRAAIENSTLKLMSKIVDFRKVAESFKELHYTDKDGNELKFGCETLLSAGIVDAKINGQEMDSVIYFKENSPLFDLADVKSQIVRYPHELLDVPNLNNTPRIIAIKKYVMRRICEIKLHKQLTPTITFDDVFKKCRMENTAREIKRDARNAIIKLFEHLKEKKFITDFELVQVRNKFVSIKFSFSKSKA